MDRKLAGLVAILAVGAVVQSSAHSGGTDSSGCHRERATGGYHCHNSKTGLSQADAESIVRAAMAQRQPPTPAPQRALFIGSQLSENCPASFEYRAAVSISARALANCADHGSPQDTCAGELEAVRQAASKLSRNIRNYCR